MQKPSKTMKGVIKEASKKQVLKPKPVRGDQPAQAQAYYVQRKNQKRGS